MGVNFKEIKINFKILMMGTNIYIYIIINYLNFNLKKDSL